MSIEPQAYTLRIGDQVCRAALMAWVNGHTAVFYLFGSLGMFTETEVIKVNMHTLEASRHLDLIKEVV